MDIKDAAWKKKALELHALLEQTCSMGLDRVWVKMMAYQRALQVITKLNGFISTQTLTEARRYVRCYEELLALYTELGIKEPIFEQIRDQLGSDCFFLHPF